MACRTVTSTHERAQKGRTTRVRRGAPESYAGVAARSVPSAAGAVGWGQPSVLGEGWVPSTRA